LNLAIQTIYTSDWQPIADIVLRNFWEYADRHGYKLVVRRYAPPYPNIGFQKLVEILDLFENNKCDIVWQLDLDSIITNHQIPVERYINDVHEVFITSGVNGINAGSFLIKNSQWSKGFIEYLLKQQGREGIHCEQDAIADYMKEYNKNPIKIVPHPSFNSFDYSLYPEHQEVRLETEGHWHEGNLLLHLPGIGMDKRQEILKNQKIIK
jgi:hypothetical protein